MHLQVGITNIWIRYPCSSEDRGLPQFKVQMTDCNRKNKENLLSEGWQDLRLIHNLILLFYAQWRINFANLPIDYS